MMANAFAAFRDSAEVVIHASGVSNSLETGAAAFDRERLLLERVRAENRRALLVYFGTCSVYDPEKRDTPYVRHKIKMESLLAASVGRWLVLRVPLAIGRNPGSQTLAQFLYHRVARGLPLEIWEGAVRYPIDVEDVLRIGRRFIGDAAMWNRCINVALRPFPVVEFVRIMEEIVGKKAHCTLVPRGRGYPLDRSEVLRVAGELDLDLSDKYLERVLRKYFGDRPPDSPRRT